MNVNSCVRYFLGYLLPFPNREQRLIRTHATHSWSLTMKNAHQRVRYAVSMLLLAATFVGLTPRTARAEILLNDPVLAGIIAEAASKAMAEEARRQEYIRKVKEYTAHAFDALDGAQPWDPRAAYA